MRVFAVLLGKIELGAVSRPVVLAFLQIMPGIAHNTGFVQVEPLWRYRHRTQSGWGEDPDYGRELLLTEGRVRFRRGIVPEIR